MRNTVRFSTLALTLLVVGAFMLAPLGSAQNPTLEIKGEATIGGIKPGLGGKNLPVDFVYRLPSSGYTIAGAQQSFAAVTITPNCANPSFQIVGPSTVLISVTPGAESEFAENDVPFAVSASRDAPGLTDIRCTISGQAGALAAAGVPASNTATYGFLANADYYGAMAVQLSNPIQRAAPQKEIPFNLELTNFGNANTRVLFRIADEADRPIGERWQHVLPTDVIVGSTAKGQDNVANAVFQVSTPYKTGWNNVVGNYLLTMNTEALDDPNQKGNTMTASILVRVRGVYVPGFEAVAVAGSLLGAVAVLRRREE